MFAGKKILLVFLPLVFAHNLPSQFKKCKIKDPSVDSCLRDAIEGAIIALSPTGNSKLGILPLDPLDIPVMKVGAGTGAVLLEQNYKNIKLFGFSKTTVKKAHLDVDNKVLTFTNLVPKFTIQGDYQVNGKVLVLPVYGDGKSELILENVIMDHTVTFDEVTKSDEKYWTIKSYTIKLATTKASYLFENLFGGNKELGDQINRVINDNWEMIFMDVKEGYELAYAAVFKIIATRLFNKIPITQIFTE